MRYFISAFVAVFMVSSQAFAAPDNSADSLMDFVKDRYSVMLDIVNKHNANKDKMRTELRKAMDTFVDFDEMAQRTLAGHWDTLNKKQRSNFVAEFKPCFSGLTSRNLMATPLLPSNIEAIRV